MTAPAEDHTGEDQFGPFIVEHNEVIRKKIMKMLYNKLKKSAYLIWQSPQSFGQKNVVDWDIIECMFKEVTKEE